MKTDLIYAFIWVLFAISDVVVFRNYHFAFLEGFIAFLFLRIYWENRNKEAE